MLMRHYLGHGIGHTYGHQLNFDNEPLDPIRGQLQINAQHANHDEPAAVAALSGNSAMAIDIQRTTEVTITGSHHDGSEELSESFAANELDILLNIGSGDSESDSESLSDSDSSYICDSDHDDGNDSSSNSDSVAVVDDLDDRTSSDSEGDNLSDSDANLEAEELK